MPTVEDKEMERYRQQVEEAAAYLEKRLRGPLDLVIQLGTGLGELAEAMEEATVCPYAEIPTFPRPRSPVTAAIWSAVAWPAGIPPSCRAAFTGTRATAPAKSPFPCGSCHCSAPGSP